MPDATAIHMPDAPGPSKPTPPAPAPDGSLTSCTLGPPALLFTTRLLTLALALAATVPTLIPRLRDAPPTVEAYRYAAPVAAAPRFYSTWCLYACVAYFGCAAVASGKRLAAGRAARRRGGGGGGGGAEARAAAAAAAAAAADGTPAAAAAAALLHAAFPASAFITHSTFWALKTAPTVEAWWEVAATVATPLGVASAGGGLAALALDVALSRVRAPRPRWLLLTTAWPLAFLAVGAVVSLAKAGGGGGGGSGGGGDGSVSPSGDAAAAAAPAAAAASTAAAASSLWTTAAAYSLGATLLAHLVGALLLGGVVLVREGCCAAGAAVVRRAKRA